MDSRESIRNLGADGECTVAPMGIAHDKNLVWIHVSEEQEFLNEILYERIDVNIIKSVPGIVGRAQCEIEVTSSFRMVLVIALHLFPLAVVEFLGSTTSAMHGDEQRPTVRRAGAHGFHGVGAQMFFEPHLLAFKIRLGSVMDGRGAIGTPCLLTDSRFVLGQEF